MARLLGNLISGAMGPYVFKIRMGKQIISKKMAPGTMKQTEATKVAAKVFGKATSLAAQLRKTLVIQYQDLFDNYTINKLNGIVFSLVKKCYDPNSGIYNFEPDSFSSLEKFEFNEKSKLSSLIKKMPLVILKKTELSVQLPPMTIPGELMFPLNTGRCDIIVALSLFRLNEGYMIELAEKQSLTITKLDKVLGPHEFTFEVPGGTLCVVTIFLDYYTANKAGWVLVKNRDFSPGRICTALISSGAYQDNDSKRWTKMVRFN